MKHQKRDKINLRRPVGVTIMTFALASMIGCMSFPKTSQEFREKAPGAMFGKSKTVEVKRRYSDLSAMFKRKAAECLNGEVVSTESGGYGTSHKVVNVVKTEVNPSKKTTELVTRYKMGGNTVGQPENGMILLVADVTAINGNSSRLDFYYGTAARIVEAIETWASGEERGCPDLTRIMERS